jgi:hypothetical protein
MMVKRYNQNRLTGANPLSYMGVEPGTPPDSTIQNRAPTIKDLGFIIGTLWINPAPIGIWMIVSVTNGVATWVPLYPNGGSGATTFPTNSGTATESGGILNILGTNVITTTGSANTVGIALTNGSNGQVIIGGGSNPVWANITSMDGTVTITNGPHSIDLEVAGGGGADSFVTNSGTAVPSAGVLNVLGANVITTTGSGNTVTVGMTEGTNGQIPIAATSGATEYANITSMDGTVTITNGPNSIDLAVTGGSGSTSPNFFYYQATNSSTLTNSTWYLGQIVALTKSYDNGSNVNPGNGSTVRATFTAPVTGTYLLGMNITSLTASSLFTPFILTSFGTFNAPQAISGGVGNTLTVLVKLNSSQTAQWGLTNTTSLIVNGGTTPYYTYIWGYLVTT